MLTELTDECHINKKRLLTSPSFLYQNTGKLAKQNSVSQLFETTLKLAFEIVSVVTCHKSVAITAFTCDCNGIGSVSIVQVNEPMAFFD